MSLIKLANVRFLEQKRTEREIIIQKALMVEQFESEGKTIDDIKAEGRNVLEIGDDGLVTLEYKDVLSAQNKDHQAFISIVNSISKLEASGMVEGDDLAVLRKSEKKLAEKIAVRLGVDEELLYEEASNE